MYRLHDIDMPSSKWTVRLKHSLLVGGLALLLLTHLSGTASPAVAQSAWGQSTWDVEEEVAAPSWGDPFGTEQSTGREAGHESLNGVPDWAAPHEMPTGTWSPDVPGTSGSEARYDIPRWNDTERRSDGVQMNGPGFPGDPNKVPIDGGLGLLLVAGAGYAAHRLRKKEDDTDADDAPLP